MNEKDLQLNKENTSDNLSIEMEYSTLLGDLWKRILFCIVGWAIACVGFVVMGNSTLPGLLLILGGAVIVELPCYKILLAGGSISALFASAFKDQIVTYKYSDGSKKKEYESNAPARIFITIIGFVITLFIGAIVVVVKIFKDFIKLTKIPAEQRGITSWAQKPWAPIVVGISAFILGIIIAVVASSILRAVERNRDDYTKEEKIVIIDGLMESVNSKDFVYVVKPYYDEAGNYLNACEVKHDAEGNKYFMSFDEQGKKDFGMSANEYIRIEGVWYIYDAAQKQLGSVVSDKEKEQLEKLTIEGIIIPTIMKENIDKVKARIVDDYSSIKVIITYRGDGNANKEHLEVHIAINESSTSKDYVIENIKYPYSYETLDAAWLELKGQSVNINSYLE